MAKNQPGVRITFDELDEMPLEEGMQRFGFSDPYAFIDYKNKVHADEVNEALRFGEANARSWPTVIKSPEAGVEMVMQNFGKGVTRDPVMIKSMFANGEHDGEFAGYTRSPYYSAIPPREYESILDTFKAAYEGDPDAAETVNNLLKESNSFKIRNSRR